MRAAALVLGLLILLSLWIGPLSLPTPGPFSRHMILHMGVVAVAAPLLALGLGGSRLDPWRHARTATPAVLAAAAEFVVIWSWHAPGLHLLARSSSVAFAVEQGSFLLAGLGVWLTALGGAGTLRAARSIAGVLGLLLTSMHMTLLGALLALAPRPLYFSADCGPTTAAAALNDQAVGGTIMLAVGGVVYLAGGLTLLARGMRSFRAAERTA